MIIWCLLHFRVDVQHGSRNRSSHSATLPERLDQQPLSHSEWLGGEWLRQSGWSSHSGRVAEWLSGWVAAPAPPQTWQEKNRHPWKYERCTQDDLTPPLKATPATASRRAAAQECWFVASMGLSTVIGLMLSTAKNSWVVACVHTPVCRKIPRALAQNFPSWWPQTGRHPSIWGFDFMGSPPINTRRPLPQRISQHLKATCHSRGFPKSPREENERIQRHELHGEWLVGLKIVSKKLWSRPQLP